MLILSVNFRFKDFKDFKLKMSVASTVPVNHMEIALI